MAYKILCDVAACRAVIAEADSGQPTLSGKRDIFCPRCEAYVADVEREVEAEANRRSFALVEELNALRQRLRTERLPQQLGGKPADGAVGWPAVTIP